jgi:DNA-binding response OmpR family regulator
MSKHRDGTARTVLLVEDDPWLRSLVGELLLDDGYRVLEAASGSEVQQLLEREGPDVLVLDLKLPGKSGLDILRELRACDPTAHLPVIVMSGALDFDTQAKLVDRSARADGVLEKPLDIGQLFEQVDRAVGSPPPRDSVTRPVATP